MFRNGPIQLGAAYDSGVAPVRWRVNGCRGRHCITAAGDTEILPPWSIVDPRASGFRTQVDPGLAVFDFIEGAVSGRGADVIAPTIARRSGTPAPLCIARVQAARAG